MGVIIFSPLCSAPHMQQVISQVKARKKEGGTMLYNTISSFNIHFAHTILP